MLHELGKLLWPFDALRDRACVREEERNPSFHIDARIFQGRRIHVEQLASMKDEARDDAAAFRTEGDALVRCSDFECVDKYSGLNSGWNLQYFYE